MLDHKIFEKALDPHIIVRTLTFWPKRWTRFQRLGFQRFSIDFLWKRSQSWPDFCILIEMEKHTPRKSSRWNPVQRFGRIVQFDRNARPDSRNLSPGDCAISILPTKKNYCTSGPPCSLSIPPCASSWVVQRPGQAYHYLKVVNMYKTCMVIIWTWN